MRDNHLYGKHLNRNSPLSQKYKQGFDGWVRTIRSVDQHPYDLSDIQLFKELADLRKKATTCIQLRGGK